MRIGILEDDPSQLELLGHWVALAGYEPQRFEHGRQLLAAIREEQFDLLILDWNLPDLSGIDVLRQVRQRSRVPVIFCTSRDREDDVVKALQERCTGLFKEAHPPNGAAGSHQHGGAAGRQCGS